ncbi:MAG: molecular chaperone TorD family protein, partial [Actinobacteria bacterium]|nr:molecular chaperone TorD family protein [Actinomycetota bacterium]MCG2803762.1 molecular chaperone TorD family protein [Cellulomonas sp.]
DTTRGLRLLARSLGRDGGPSAGEGATRAGDSVAREHVEPETLESLRRDYADLFVGPGPLLAPPYESVHLTADRLLFDEPTMQVRSAYRAFDLVAPRLNREPDDHLGLELHFLTELCTRALDAIEAGDEFVLDTTLAAHHGFLTDHVLRWAPDLFGLVAAHATTSFYRGVAALGTATLGRARDDLAP